MYLPKSKMIIPSPLNYTGGKFRLLKYILPHFPQEMDKVVDLFCGGCNVGINVNCNNVLFNDKNERLIGLFNALKHLPKETILSEINEIIRNYGLSLVSINGYDFYGCESSRGLGNYNRERFIALRQNFNARREHDEMYFLMLYVLIVYSFNNQLRFNSKGEFNLPVGKRDFNWRMQKKLSDFIDRIQSEQYEFISQDFREIDVNSYTENSFFYIDPPYLITCAGYNENDGWTDADEQDLLAFIDGLDELGIKFALSNVLTSNGKKNELLNDWLASRKYRVIDLDYSYANSNYHKKNIDRKTREILAINY